MPTPVVRRYVQVLWTQELERLHACRQDLRVMVGVGDILSGCPQTQFRGGAFIATLTRTYPVSLHVFRHDGKRAVVQLGHDVFLERLATSFQLLRRRALPQRVHRKLRLCLLQECLRECRREQR